LAFTLLLFDDGNDFVFDEFAPVCRTSFSSSLSWGIEINESTPLYLALDVLVAFDSIMTFLRA